MLVPKKGHPHAPTAPQALQLIWLTISAELLASVYLIHAISRPELQRSYTWRLLPVGSLVYQWSDLLAGTRLFDARERLFGAAVPEVKP